MNIEFLKFDFTPTEKHLGIATIRYEKRFIFRFKVIAKDAGGFYIQPASYKIPAEGKDSYLSAFTLDSSYESEEIKIFIEHNVKSILANKKTNTFDSDLQNSRQSLYKPNQPDLCDYNQNKSVLEANPSCYREDVQSELRNAHF